MPEPALWATKAVPQMNAQSISMRECLVCVLCIQAIPSTFSRPYR